MGEERRKGNLGIFVVLHIQLIFTASGTITPEETHILSHKLNHLDLPFIQEDFQFNNFL